MTEIVIHGLPPSSYVRTALLMCHEKGAPYRLEPVDFRSDAYLQMHPFRKMPAMTHGEVKLYEALAIGSYVDSFFDGPSLQPENPLGRAMMFQWISAINDYVYDMMVRKCVSERFVKPMRGLEPDEAVIAEALPAIQSQLDVLDAGLSCGDYLCGDTLSLADLFLGPVLTYFAATPEGKAHLPERARLAAWLARMEARPGYAQINSFG